MRRVGLNPAPGHKMELTGSSGLMEIKLSMAIYQMMHRRYTEKLAQYMINLGIRTFSLQ